MKRSKKLYILLGVLVIVCGVTFGVSRYEQKKEEIKNSDEIILELKTEDVTALSWEYDETKLAFHKDETWLYDEDDAFPVNDQKVEDMLGLFESFGVSFIIENVEDYAQYGLDDPACTIHIETEADTYDIQLGNYSTMDEERYVSIGDGNVYLVSTDPMETFEIELKDMILHDELPSIDQADMITFEGCENYQIVYQEESDATYNTEDVYFVGEDDNYLPLDTSTVENYLLSVENLNLTKYVSYNATEQELEEYGLNDPELTMTIQYMAPKEENENGEVDGESEESKTFVLQLSRSAEEKAKVTEDDVNETSDSMEEEVPAYVRIGESNIIYEVTESEYDSLMAASYNELRHQEIFWADFSEVYKVDISMDDTSYTLTSKEEDEETIWSYGDEEVAIDEFKSALNLLTASEFTDTEVDGKEEISLTLYLNNENYPTVQIGLYRQDGEHCTAVVDGETVALVARSEVVDLIEAVNTIVLN